MSDVRALPNKLAKRPIVGGIVVPYMVDENAARIDFRVLDPTHLRLCAKQRRCGICAKPMDHGLYAFLGPDRELACYDVPWMHEACATYTIGECPFVSGRKRRYRERDEATEVLEEIFERMALVIAKSGSAHFDERIDAWHFEAKGIVERRPIE